MTIELKRRFLDLSGPALSRGLEHGRVGRSEILALIADVCPPGWDGDPLIARRVERELDAMSRIGGSDYVEEMLGIAVGAGIPFETIARLNLIVGTDAVPGVASVAGMYRATCTAIALIDPNAGPVTAKNGDGDRHQGRWYWVQRVRPDAGPPTLGATYIGTVWLDSGINEHGLAVVQTAGPGRMDQGPGLPCCMMPRYLLEHATSTAEAIDVIQSTPMSGFGAIFVLVDANGAIAVVEKVSDQSAVRPAQRGYSWAVNTFESPALVADAVPMPLDGLDVSNAVRCSALAGLGDAGPASLEGILSTLRTKPIWQQGPGSFWSVHTAAYRCRDRTMLVGGDDPSRELLEYQL